METNTSDPNYDAASLSVSQQRFLPMGFETFAQAKERRKSAKRALRRGRKSARKTRRVLIGCRKGERCGTECCAVCLRGYRRDLMRAVQSIFKSRPHWTRASVIAAGFSVPYGSLNQVDVSKIVATIRKRLQRSPGLRQRIVFGGIDLSLNVRKNVIQHWQLHFYLLVEGKKSSKLRAAIKAAFPPEPTAPRPYQFKNVKDYPEAASYAYKSMFNRRSEYRKNQKARTWPLPLKQADLRELFPLLRRTRLGGRLILHGLRRNGKPIRLYPTSSSTVSVD